MKTKIEICKEYFALHKKMFLETQFNRKVELNTKIHNFKKEYVLDVQGQEPLLEVFIGSGIDKEFIGQIVVKYGKKNRNLECPRIGYDYKLINN
jgi:hypothetical protein